MKKLCIALLLSFMAIWSIGAMADEEIGVVDMQTIFKSSPRAQAINKALKSQFASRKENIVKMGKALQTEIQQYQKNQAVMDKTKIKALQEKINKQSVALRQAQAKFQQDLVTEQNKKMKEFIDDVKSAVAKVAGKKDLEVVLPSNAVLYSKPKLDITSDVLSNMK